MEQITPNVVVEQFQAINEVLLSALCQFSTTIKGLSNVVIYYGHETWARITYLLKKGGFYERRSEKGGSGVFRRAGYLHHSEMVEK